METMGIIPHEMMDKVECELERGENLVWIEMPRPAFFTSRTLSMFLFAIPWTAFSLFWITMAYRGTSSESGPGAFFPLFGIPFVLVGLGMLSSPIWNYRKASRTVYFITDRRAVTIETLFRTTVCSYSGRQLREVYRREKRNGRGDIIITKRTWRDSDGDSRSSEEGFMNVSNVREVERMLRELAQKQIG